MPKFYCDYCDTYLTHDSPSVRKTHCSGRKHKENVKDYYQKWMEEQAQSLIDKTTAAFQQGKIPPTPFSAPPPGGAMIPPPPSIPGPPRPGMMPAPHMGGPPMMPMMGPPPPGMMPVGPGKSGNKQFSVTAALRGLICRMFGVYFPLTCYGNIASQQRAMKGAHWKIQSNYSTWMLDVAMHSFACDFVASGSTFIRRCMDGQPQKKYFSIRIPHMHICADPLSSAW
uniref:U1 small nuclear ribonucleoprotein C n=1 Tax=Dromaius novaehollandiae TaxID=8790 RepID=A0A8C4KAK5_DRONO